MSPQMLTLILWLPFALIVLISGIIFCISGYKKGLWQAFVALGAAALATVLSVFLARFLGGLLAPLITGWLPLEELEGSGVPVAFLLDLVGSFVKMGFALVFFPLLLLILTVILRSVSGAILKDKLLPKGKGMRWGGLAVGAVTAVLFSLIFLLPLYGTMGTYVPVFKAVLDMPAEEDETLEQVLKYVGAVDSHPVVKVSGSGPVGLVYGGLTEVRIGEARVNVAVAARSAGKLMACAADMLQADPEDMEDYVQELIQILRDDVTQTRWFYEASKELARMMQEALDEVEDSNEKDMALKLLAAVDSPRDVFQDNCDALLDFTAYALNNEFLTILEEKDMEALYDSGILERLGYLLNCSQEFAVMKGVMMETILEESLEENAAVLRSYDLDECTEDPDEQFRDAEAVMQMLLAEGRAPYSEFIMRTPALGEAALMKLADRAGFAVAMGYEEDRYDAVAAVFDQNPALQQKLVDKLAQCASGKIGTKTFADARIVLLETAHFANTGEYTYSKVEDPEAFSFALDAVGEEGFTNGEFAAGREVYIYYRTMLDAIAKEPEAIIRQKDGVSYTESFEENVYALAVLVRDTREGKLSTNMGEYLQNFGGYVMTFAESYLTNNSSFLAIRDLVDTYGSDPLDLEKNISRKQKQFLQEVLETMWVYPYVREACDERYPGEQRFEYYYKFFGMD